jgi:hypothetical protein
MMEPSTSWFGKACDFIRPWDDDNDEGISIPEEQKQAFVKTREVSSETTSLPERLLAMGFIL